MAVKTYKGIDFDTDVDYKKKENEALAKGDRLGAARYEMQRNAKIDSLGLGDKWAKENKYGTYAGGTSGEIGSERLSWKDLNTDYTAAKNQFEKHGDYDAAARMEEMHNKKNDILGLGYENTNAYNYWLENPAYKNEYQNQMSSLLGDMKDSTFEFDPENNAAWRAIKAQHNREAERVTEDTMGAYAGMTGGVPSSYAVSAAAQAGASERAKATDRLSDIYSMEFERYMAELENKQRMFNNYATLDERNYGRYVDDREFEYGAARDRTSDAQWQTELDYQKGRAAASDAQWQTDHNLKADMQETDKEHWEKEFNHELAQDNHAKDLDILQTYININDASGIRKWFEDRGLTVPENIRTADMMDYAMTMLNKTGEQPSDFSLFGDSVYTGASSDESTGGGQTLTGAQIIEKAISNGGVVTDAAEWKILTDRYGEKELADKGYRYAGGAA